jgi:hypothetical protein
MDQHCLSCGRDTAAGSEQFASRKRGIDRQTRVEGYLCYALPAWERFRWRGAVHPGQWALRGSRHRRNPPGLSP